MAFQTINRLRGLLLLLSVTCVCAEPIHHDLLINGAQLVSPELDGPPRPVWVRIHEGRIEKVSDVPLEATARDSVIDADGLFLTPGLTDSHVHLGAMPGLPLGFTSTQGELHRLQELYVRQEPRSYLYFGVTQVVDLASSPQAIASFVDQPLHPDAVFCGAVPIPRGYPLVFAEDPERAQASFPYLWGRSASGEKLVREIQSAEGKCVKVYIEDGFGNRSDWPMISEDALTEIRDAAKRRGLPVVAHANAFDMQKIAEKMQVDVIAHGMWNWNEHSVSDESLPEPIRQLLDRIIAGKIAYQPTLTVIDALSLTVAWEPMTDPLYSKSTPREILNWYSTPEAAWFQETLIADWDGAGVTTILGQLAATYDQGARVAAYLAENGALLALGSDTPSSPVAVSQPGLNTYRELMLWAEAGLDLRTLFRAATIDNARVFGVDQDYGTVEPGKVANLLLLRENPLDAVGAYDSIQTVILRGVAIERETLSAQR